VLVDFENFAHDRCFLNFTVWLDGCGLFTDETPPFDINIGRHQGNFTSVPAQAAKCRDFS
jgi:hypothetical protein